MTTTKNYYCVANDHPNNWIERSTMKYRSMKRNVLFTLHVPCNVTYVANHREHKQCTLFHTDIAKPYIANDQ